MARNTNKNPRVFISYSWTSPEHEKWVLYLATKLYADGIYVVMDKFDLHAGHDTHAYMEKMVTDKSISKVLLVCDLQYARKAEKRKGGVGTEVQIISREIYEKVEQDKFIPIVVEYDKQNKPALLKGSDVPLVAEYGDEIGDVSE